MRFFEIFCLGAPAIFMFPVSLDSYPLMFLFVIKIHPDVHVFQCHISFSFISVFPVSLPSSPVPIIPGVFTFLPPSVCISPVPIVTSAAALEMFRCVSPRRASLSFSLLSLQVCCCHAGFFFFHYFI